MIEKLFDFLTSKNSLENSKIVKTLSFLVIGILASSWYSYSFYKYSVNFEYKFLIDFIFSGKIIPCLILYGLVYFASEITEVLLYMIYSFLLYAKIKKRADNTIITEGKIQIKKDYLKLRDIFKPFLISVGMLLMINNEIKMHKEIRTILKKYCDEPRTIVVNLINLLVLIIMYYIAYNINLHDLSYIPNWLNYIVNGIFWTLIIIIPIIITTVSIFEVNIPALRIVYDKVKPME